MNDEDKIISDLLAPLRRAKPTAAMRDANRRAVIDVVPVTPWWRRTVSVPVPVALATAASLAIAVFVVATDHRSIASQERPGSVPVSVAPNIVSTSTSDVWSVSYSYLGQLQSGDSQFLLPVTRSGNSS